MKTNKSKILFVIVLAWFTILNSCNSDSEDIPPFVKINSPLCDQITVKKGDRILYSFTFDSLNNIKTCENKSGYVYTYNYNDGRLISSEIENPFYFITINSYNYNGQGMVSAINYGPSNEPSTLICSMGYDKMNRLQKVTKIMESFMETGTTRGEIQGFWQKSTQTTEIKYGVDGNILYAETEYAYKNLNNPHLKEKKSYYKYVYSGYDSYPNAFRFLVNSFYLQLLMENYDHFTSSSASISGYFPMSVNNPTTEKVYRRSENEKYILKSEYTYNFEYSDGLVSRVIKKDSTRSLEDLTFEYSCK